MHSLSAARRALEAVDLVQGLAETEVRSRLQQGLHLRATGQRILAFYLVEMTERRLHFATGHRSTVLYAEAELGLDRRRTGELIAVGRTLLTVPAIDRAFCEQRLGWSKLVQLVKVATPEHEAAWLERALEISCRDLALQVTLSRPGSRPRRPGETKGTPEVRFPHACTLAPVAHQKIELAKQKLSAELGRAVGEAECLEVMADLFLNLEEDGSVPGRTRVNASLYRIVLRPIEDAALEGHERAAPEHGPLAVETEPGPVPLAADHDIDRASVACDAEVVRVDDQEGPGCTHLAQPTSAPSTSAPSTSAPPTPSRLRARVLTRDGLRCRFCRSSHRLCAHHIRFRAKGGETKAFNLITLCTACHSLVHADLLVLVGDRAADIVFERRPEAPTATARLPDLAVPVCATVDGAPAPHTALPGVTTLDSLPPVVDGVWWRRHSHLLRVRQGRGLEFRAGHALPEDAPAEAASAKTLDTHVSVRKASVRKASVQNAFRGVVGQDALLGRLRNAALGSRRFGRCFPHTCLVGPAGTGKTTLARCISQAYGSRLVSTSGPLLQDTHGLIGLLASLRQGDMLFLDEIHAVPQAVLEVLYEAVDSRRIELTVRCDARARTLALRLPAFTLLAATTEEDRLPPALRSRFGVLEHLGFYAEQALATLAQTSALEHGFCLVPPAAATLAAHARGTPRETLRLLERVLEDLVQDGRVQDGRAGDGHGGSGEGVIRLGAGDVRAALTRLGYDAERLGPVEQRYLALLRGSPEPIPLARLARLHGSTARALTEHLEPYLFRRGLVEMTARGRQARPAPRQRSFERGASLALVAGTIS